MRIIGRLLLVLACTATFHVASAATQEDYDNCNNADPDRRILGCTLVINDAKESQKNRALGHYQRGLGYEKKGQFGAAIADYNDAIKLKIEGDYAAKRRDYVAKKKEAIDRAAPTLGSLDGTWEGDLLYPSKDGSPTKPSPYRIVINGTSAKVFMLTDGKEREIKPAEFAVHRYLTNAVVMAIDSGTDEDGIWVETWSFAVTLKDKNTLITNFTRVVNNANLPLSIAHSKFSLTASGEFQRK